MRANATFHSAIAKRIEHETLAREGKAVTVNELVESLLVSFRELEPQLIRSHLLNPAYAFLENVRQTGVADAKGISSVLKSITPEEREGFMKSLDVLVREATVPATDEAKAFAQSILQDMVGPEYRGWAPSRTEPVAKPEKQRTWGAPKSARPK